MRINDRRKSYAKRLLFSLILMLALSYNSLCIFLFIRQRYIMYRATPEFDWNPSSARFKLPYREVWITVGNSGDRLHAWWIPAPSSQEKASLLPNEPARILKSNKVLLFFPGIGKNKGAHNYLSRLREMRQLGFSVLVIDYRGYGGSEGDFPSESQIYEDSQAAWNYLIQIKRIPPKEVVIYGVSLGGAIALDLAVKHPEAGGVIVQSSFTSMAEAIKHIGWFWLFPIDLLLTQRFDSLSKVRNLKIPVLFLHGTADTVVSSEMSRQLYNVAPEPKQIFLVPKAGHFTLYQPKNSYLPAVQKFMEELDNKKRYLEPL